MERKVKVSVDDKIRAIKDYLTGKKSVSQICLELQIHRSAFDELQLAIDKYIEFYNTKMLQENLKGLTSI